MTVQTTTLPNGIRVITDHMASVQTVSIGAWVDVGTRHELPDVNGVSHFLEHMAFKGTRTRSAMAIAEEIENVGGHLNAYTSRENTAYYAKVLKEDTPLALDIVADILQYSVMDPEELERERGVIIQEIHQANDTPDDIIFDYFQETAYPDQALGRPVLGEVELIRSLTREQIVSYMKGTYTTPRLVISAAGHITHDDVLAMVSDAFVDLPTDPAQAPQGATYFGGERQVIRDLEQTHLVVGFDSIAYGDDDFYAASIFSILFGGGMSSRLFQEVREKRGLAYTIYSFLSSYDDGGTFGIYAGTSPEETAGLVPVLAAETKKARNTISEEEVQRARAQLKASILMSLESTSSRSEQLARQLMVYGRAIPVEEIIRKIEAVDTRSVMRAAERITSSKPTLTTVGPKQGLVDYTALCKGL